MRSYELIFIVNPDLDETALTDLINRVKGWIVDDGGEVTKIDLWGKRRLAYSIRKQTEGYYVFFKTIMAPKFGVTLERNLRFLEPVIRFLVVAD
jgi:small subunit ribosomal protein S6